MKLYCINTSLRFFTFIAYLILPAVSLLAQRTPVVVTKAAAAIRFDGIVNESVWHEATRFPVIRQAPDYKAVPSEETDIRMIYDDQYLFFAARLLYKDPAKIQDYSKQRDGGGPMDYIAFAFDGYNDKTNGQAFATTPSGLRWDAAIIFNSTGVNIDASWNTYWEVKTSRDTAGWYAEFKIPLSSLRFYSSGEEVIMNFIAWRILAYKNEFEVYPDIPPDWGVLSFANIAEGYPLLFKGIKSSNPLYITPYVLGGFTRNQVQAVPGENYKPVQEHKLDAGVDMKYSVSTGLTLDITANTDFAQAEADQFQVNLGRSSLFFPEKREFFLERNNNFSFSFDKNNTVFYSRRIGLQQGEVERIYAGARLVGRIGKWDIGLMNMQAEDNRNDRNKNLSVLRVKKQVKDGNSYYGAVFTSSIGAPGLRFYTTGADMQLALTKKNFFRVALAKTFTDSARKEWMSADNLRLNARLERPAEAGFHYVLNYSLAGDDYKPETGFEERGNIMHYEARAGYGFLTSGKGNVYRHLVRASGYRIDGYLSRLKESAGADMTYLLEWKNGAALTINPYYREEILNHPLVLSAANRIMPGGYYYNGIKTSVTSPVKKPFNVSFSAESGGFFNGRLLSAVTALRWDGSGLLQLLANYRTDQISFPDNQPVFRNHIVSLSAIFNFTTQFSLNSLLQYDKLNEKMGANIRFRYNAKEGNDLFFVLTNIANTNRERLYPALPAVQNWLIIAKYKHTFMLQHKKRR